MSDLCEWCGLLFPPHTNGGNPKRFCSVRCRSASSSKRYHVINRKKLKTRKHEWYVLHRDDVATRRRKHRDARRKQEQARARSYALTHRDQARAANRRYREAHKEEIRRRRKHQYATDPRYRLVLRGRRLFPALMKSADFRRVALSYVRAASALRRMHTAPRTG